MADFQTIGQSHIRVDALEKVTGKATYAGDVYLPGMLMCKLLVSTHSHAKIVSIDASAAEELPGVRCVITGKDYPDARFGSGGQSAYRRSHGTIGAARGPNRPLTPGPDTPSGA